MTVGFLWHGAVPMFVKCLESLPNLHTLEIGMLNYHPRTSNLRNAIKDVKFPQIKALILPPTAHPFLKHCPNVEDVDWVMRDRTMTSDEFLGSVASIRGSNVKRLAIPLIVPGSPSRK